MKQLYVRLEVLSKHDKKALGIIDHQLNKRRGTQRGQHVPTSTPLNSNDVNILVTRKDIKDHVEVTTIFFDLLPYGDIPGLAKFKEEGIAYDRLVGDSWRDRDYSYTSLRFSDEGEAILMCEHYRDRYISDKSIKKWLERFGETEPKTFVSILREMVESNDRMYDPLPWTDQVRNARKYQTMRLLTNGQD